MNWIVSGVLVSLLMGVVSEINRRYKLDGFRLNFWRSLVIVVLLTPAMFTVEWPSLEALFYLSAVLTGVIAVVGMTLHLNLAANHNGRIAALYAPIKMYVVYLLWLVVDGEARTALFVNTGQTVGVMLMFALAAYAMFNMRSNDASWKGLLLSAPIGVLFAISDTISKVGLLDVAVPKLDAVLVFVFLMFSFAVVLSGCMIMARNRPDKPLLPPNMPRAAALMGGVTLVNLIIFYSGLVTVDNPAYLTALTMLTPVWFIVYHKMIGVKDDANPVMGLLLVASAVGLVLLAGGK